MIVTPFTQTLSDRPYRPALESFGAAAAVLPRSRLVRLTTVAPDQTSSSESPAPGRRSPIGLMPNKRAADIFGDPASMGPADLEDPSQP